MTGSGEVLKRRIQDGDGDFPIDCPLHDTTVKAHLRVRLADQGGAGVGEWLYDSRQGQGWESSCSSSGGADADGGSSKQKVAALEFDTGTCTCRVGGASALLL